MTLNELIKQINKSVEELDLVTTRKYIDDNLEILYQNRNLLKGNARDLLEFLANRKVSDLEPLTRTEMAAVHALNSYAAKFDLRSIKLTIKGKAQFLLRKDIKDYLN